MDAKSFDEVFETTVESSRKVLVTKAGEYAAGNDRLHNFKKAAALIGCTPDQALWGFLTKHLVSLSDMVESDEDYSYERWDEKIGDSINYLILLRAVVEDMKVAANAFQANP